MSLTHASRMRFRFDLQGVPPKTTQSLRHHNFATTRHRVMRFLTKCSERDCLRVKSQCWKQHDSLMYGCKITVP